LERLAAEYTGKEAGLLVTSGTQGNLVCLKAHTQPGDEVIMEAEAHVFWYEVGGLAAVAGLMARSIKGQLGALDPLEVEASIRPPNIHYPRTALICLENTHNRAGGTVLTLEQMASVAEVAQRHDIPVHLDGARVFNAAVALGVDVKEITRHVDTVTFCLSKGLSAPVGSLICGSADFISKAKRIRKMLGGTLRQSGIIAAAGIVALESMVERLHEDHKHARLLGEGLAKVPGLQVDMRTVQTNMVRIAVSELGIDANQFLGHLARFDIRALAQGPHAVRFVTHRAISGADVEHTVESVRRICAELRPVS
jgi:threonine aldolase